MGVSVRACSAGGGMALTSDKSPSGVICSGGTHDGQPIDLAKINPVDLHNPVAVKAALDEELKELGNERAAAGKKS